MHTEILSEAQRGLLPHLGKVLAGLDFYMAGGMALALQIGHRSSVDFDWFMPRLGSPEAFLRNLKSSNMEFKVESIDFETIYLDIGSVQVSFIGYDYSLLQPKVFWPDYGIHLAGIDDIACMKLSAIASRGSRKDFIDLHYILKNYRSLEEYLKLFVKKYENRDFGHVVRSLVYFDDAESEPEIRTVEPLDWEQLKADFEELVKALKEEKDHG